MRRLREVVARAGEVLLPELHIACEVPVCQQHEVFDVAGTVLADADEALGRTHVPSRIRAWHELLRESTFTSAGRARLETRLRRR